MKNFFKPEDFNVYPDELLTAEQAFMLANERLNSLIESWTVVYSYNGEDDWFITQPKNPDVKFKARLAFIEEIVKEPCKHDPVLYSVNLVYRPNGRLPGDEIYVCKHCGVQLQATWSEKK